MKTNSRTEIEKKELRHLNLRMGSKHLTILLTTISLFFSGCAKDKDMDDYKLEKLQSELAELKAVEGSYTGYLNSKKDPQINLGSLKINLTATTQTAANNDGSKTDATPILVSEIEFQGNYQIVFSGKNSFYNSNTGQYNSEIPIEIAGVDGKRYNETITLTGAITGSNFVGTMQLRGYSDVGGIFTLQLNGPSTRELSTRRKPDLTMSDRASQFIYAGVTSSPDGRGTRPITMYVNYPLQDKYTEMYYILNPRAERLLQFSILLDQASNVNGPSFSHGSWDPINGTVSARQEFSLGSTNNLILSLNCRNFYFEQTRYNFSCEYSSSVRNTNIRFDFIKN